MRQTLLRSGLMFSSLNPNIAGHDGYPPKSNGLVRGDIQNFEPIFFPDRAYIASILFAKINTTLAFAGALCPALQGVAIVCFISTYREQRNMA